MKITHFGQVVKPTRLERMRNAKGSNQYQAKKKARKDVTAQWMFVFLCLIVTLIGIRALELEVRNHGFNQAYAEMPIVSPLAPEPTKIPNPTPTPTEKEKIVAYITRLWEKHGTDQVVLAINCFYSESGLRMEAVGQNSDSHKSKDYGVAQINDYWQKPTEKEKTDIYAHLDKAYKIYKGRGNTFEAWYGKRCN